MLWTLKLLQKIRSRTVVSSPIFLCQPLWSPFQIRFCHCLWSLHPRTLLSPSILWTHHICRWQFFSALVRPHEPNGLLPDYVPCRHCSRSCIFETSLATPLFQHECRIFWMFPIVSLYFVPRAHSPLIHLLATLLSPHSCTVGPSSRVWTVMSSGPESLGVFFLSLFPLSFFLVFLCSVDSFILFRMKVTNLHFSSGEFCFFLAIIQSSLPAQPVAILSHKYPWLCHLHSYFHLMRFSGSSFIILVRMDCTHLVLLHLYTYTEMTGPSAPISSWPYYLFLYGTQPTSHLNNLVIVFVSHPFIFPMSVWFILPLHWPKSGSPSSATDVRLPRSLAIGTCWNDSPHFQRRPSLITRHLTQKVRTVCIVVVHDPSHVLRFVFIEGCSYVQACLYIVGPTTHASSSIFQAHFPSRSATRCNLRTM